MNTMHMIHQYHQEIPTVELFYICDDDFRKEVDQVRKMFDIKTNSEGIVEVEDIIHFDKQILTSLDLKKRYYDQIHRLCQKYRIVDYFNDVEVFVESGLTNYGYNSQGIQKSTTITKPEVKTRKRDLPKNFGCRVEFIVREPITQKDLNDWFIKNKDMLLIEANDYFRGFKRSITKLEKLDKILKIIKLRDENDLSFSQIADKLSSWYPNDKDAIDGKINEVSVRKIYSRFKNRFKRDSS